MVLQKSPLDNSNKHKRIKGDYAPISENPINETYVTPSNTILISIHAHRLGVSFGCRLTPPPGFQTVRFTPVFTQPAPQSLGDVEGLQYLQPLIPKAPKGCLWQITSWRGFPMAVPAMVVKEPNKRKINDLSHNLRPQT